MTKQDHARMAWNAVPVVCLFLAFMVTDNMLVAILAVMAICWWLMTLVHTTNHDDILCTWWVGDPHGNGSTVYAKTEQEAIAKVAQEVFDLRTELVGTGKIK